MTKMIHNEWFTTQRKAEAACVKWERKGYQTILRHMTTGNDLDWQVVVFA